jgi:PrcB C-terminal
MVYLRDSARRCGFFFGCLAVALLIGVTAACARAAARPADSAHVSIPVTTVEKGNFSGIAEPLETVVRTPAEWESLWHRHVSIQSPPSPLPQINFADEMVVAVFLGQKNSGGYEITITNAQRKASEVEVFYAIQTPKSGALAIQAITQPFHIVKMPRSDGPVHFVRNSS